MTDTLTTAKSLTKQTVGGNSGTWGTILDSTIELIDKALGQTLSKAPLGDVTLTSTEAQNIGYDFTGALTANAAITFPTFYGPAFIRNKTTGGFTVTVGMASGLTVQVPAASNAFVFSDGTDFVSPTATPASAHSQPTNPTGTVSTTAVHMGLAGSITPTRHGTVLFIISGDAQNITAGDGFAYHIRYGTGSAPANGAALTGTATSAVALEVASGGTAVPFSTQGIVTGLRIGTAYWFDLALATFIGGTAAVTNLTCNALEV